MVMAVVLYRTGCIKSRRSGGNSSGCSRCSKTDDRRNSCISYSNDAPTPLEELLDFWGLAVLQ